jgi:hypothetical protein
MLKISNPGKLIGHSVKVAGVDLTITHIGIVDEERYYLFTDRDANMRLYLGRQIYHKDSTELCEITFVDNLTGFWIKSGIEPYWLQSMDEFIRWMGCAIWYRLENGVQIPYASMDDAKQGKVQKVFRTS